MKKLKINTYYKINGYTLPLRFIGIFDGDYTCDYCNKNHYYKTLPKLYWFEVKKDNWLKVGTSCITKILKG